MKSIRTTPSVHAGEGDERIRTAVPAPSTDPAYELLAEIALLAWNATGGDRDVDPTDAWNDLCTLLEAQDDLFGDRCRALVHGGAS